MSDTTDDMDRYFSMMEAYQEITDDYINKGIWMKKDGTEIKIKNMELSHLKNTIAMVNRNNPDSRYLPVLNKELNKRLKHLK